MTVKGAFWLCLAVLLLAPRWARAEDARLPYKELYAMQKVEIDLGRAHPNLALVLQMRSTRTGVKPGAIAAFIDAKSGPIAIPIGADGAFKVPVRDDLLAEAPWVDVNQPKGTMQLNWHAGLAPSVARSMTNAVHYGALMRIVRECDEVQEAMRQFFPTAPRLTAVGLRLTFRSSAIAPMAIIHARGGNRRLQADTLGELIVPLDGDLMEEDPLMTLTDTNVAVEIVTRKEGATP
ncbi:MAG TPA: hypothetical protein VGO59_19380 [Verrucomicrobiae bacterium]|jgi:hypothetical protein